MPITTPSSGERDFDCIEPGLGELIWRIDDPTTSSELRDRLQLHVRHCAACRVDVALAREVADGLSRGRFTLDVPAQGLPAWARWTTTLGAAALAACLALILLLPPRLPGGDRILRGTDEPGVESPLPDTVIHDRTPSLRWTALARADRYRVSVREVGGDYVWEGETTDAEITLPDDADLPTSARLRVEVAPVPSFAAPDGALRSSFRTGGWREFLGFRLGAAPRSLLGGALVGVLALLAGAGAILRLRN